MSPNVWGCSVEVAVDGAGVGRDPPLPRAAPSMHELRAHIREQFRDDAWYERRVPIPDPARIARTRSAWASALVSYRLRVRRRPRTAR